MTAYELRIAGLMFVRDEHASLVAVRGPQSLCEEAKAQVQRRVTAMSNPHGSRWALTHPEAVGTASNPHARGSRWGACEQCGDTMESYRGGWCELCALARRVALKAKGVAL